MFFDAADHAAINERSCRRVTNLQLYAPGLAAQLHVEVAILFEDGARIVGFVTAIEYGQRTATKQLVHTALLCRHQLRDFALREVFQAAERRHPRMDEIVHLLLRYGGYLKTIAHNGSVGAARR